MAPLLRGARGLWIGAGCLILSSASSPSARCSSSPSTTTSTMCRTWPGGRGSPSRRGSPRPSSERHPEGESRAEGYELTRAWVAHYPNQSGGETEEKGFRPSSPLARPLHSPLTAGLKNYHQEIFPAA